MIIDHVDIEIKITPVDRRNAPIQERSLIMTAKVAQMVNVVQFERLHLPPGWGQQIADLLAAAQRAKDPYDD
jgi:hypothetical protein